MKSKTKLSRVRKLHNLINKSKRIDIAYCEIVPYYKGDSNVIVVMAVPVNKDTRIFRREYQVKPTIINLIKIFMDVMKSCK